MILHLSVPYTERKVRYMKKPHFPSLTYACPICKQITGHLITYFEEKQAVLDDGNAQYVCINHACRCRFKLTPSDLYIDIQECLLGKIEHSYCQCSQRCSCLLC